MSDDSILAELEDDDAGGPSQDAARRDNPRSDDMVLGLDDCVGMLERLFDMSIAIARQREEICTRIADSLKSSDPASVDQTLRTIKNRLSSSEAVRVYRHLKPDASLADSRKYVEEL